MELLLPVLLIAVFYFLLIRPQQRQRKQMMHIQQSLVPGSRVMTGSGLFGTVVNIDGDEVELEVAPGVTNHYARRAIVNVIEPAESESPDVTPEIPDDASGLTDGLTDTDQSSSASDIADEHTNGDDKR